MYEGPTLPYIVGVFLWNWLILVSDDNSYCSWTHNSFLLVFVFTTLLAASCSPSIIITCHTFVSDQISPSYRRTLLNSSHTCSLPTSLCQPASEVCTWSLWLTHGDRFSESAEMVASNFIQRLFFCVEV